MRLTYLLLALFLFSCGDSPSDPWADCKLPKPTAIFANNNNVTNHQFNIKGLLGTETATFRNGVDLELIQSGCEKINQEFKFKFAGKHADKNADFWVKEAITQFRYMAGLSPNLVHFGDWASAIEVNASKLKMGQETEVAPTIYITIDKIVSSDVTLLLVLLSNK